MNARHAAVGLLVFATALAACGDDGGPTEPDGNNSLVLVSGDNQQGQAGRVLPGALSVEVRSPAGDPVPDVMVTWDVPSAAAPDWVLGEITTTTMADGRTANWFALGSAVGSYQIRASIDGSSSVTFSASATSSPVEIVSGNGQVGLAGTTLAQPLVVRVSDSGGSPVAGVQLSFQVTEAPGSGAAVDPVTATTAADGTAQTVLTLGDTNGLVRVTAATSTASRVLAACTYGGTAGPLTLQLAPGEDAVVTGSDASCVQLPAQTAGDAYEVVVMPLPQALSFNDVALSVAGTAAAAAQVVSPEDLLAARPSYSAVGVEQEIERERRRAQYEWDEQLRRLEAPLRPEIRAQAVGRGEFGLMAAAPVVGQQMTFNFSCVTTEQFPNAPSSITAEVVAVSGNAVIFEDVLASGSYTTQEYVDIATNFDEVILGADTLYFGSPEDVAGDIAPGQVVIVYSSGVNNMTEDYRQGYISGFFCPLDLGFAGGNNAKMFYVAVPDPTGQHTPASGDALPKDVARSDTDNTVAHEFQHLINAQTGTGSAQEIWINEGLSHLAEEIVGHAAAGHAGLVGFVPGAELGPDDFLQSAEATEIFNTYYIGDFVNLGLYLDAPGDTAALLNSQDPLGQETFRMRGSAWSFVRYLLDRFGQPATEWQLSRQLINAGSTDSRQAVGEVFGVPFNELAADWSAMLVSEDRTDLVGPVRSTLELPSYQLRTLYEHPSFRFVISPSGGWPLVPTSRGLTGASTIPWDLFTGTAEYVTLTASEATSGTGLRLQTSQGADLSPTSVVPYLVIVRTK